ncbi:MAG: sensor histidine kinase [Actinocatenispora sp.]
MTITAAAPGRQPRQLLAQLRVDSLYCLTGLPIAVVGFVAVLTLFAVGTSLSITFGGLFVLLACVKTAGLFARLERAWLPAVLGRRITAPRYKSPAGKTGLGRTLTPLTDPQSWRDLLFGVFAMIPAIFTFVVTVVWWAVGIGFTLDFTWAWATFDIDSGVSDLLGFPHTYGPFVAVNTVIGLLFLASTPFVVRGMALTRSGLARLLLIQERAGALQDRVDELTLSREAIQEAEASALRRLERDIHDGPQQRLVRLTMDLSLAKRRLETDPERTAPLLDEAIEQTRETLDELRALSRGIAPPILTDRGLGAALNAVTGRCTVPVELEVSLATGDRLPASIENAAYFLVAEALTNVAKHSRATWAKVRLNGDGSLLYVTISDNGVGGAHTAKGHGLAGLADRVRAVDGRFDVQSPEGGPTVITAELPCAS